MSSFNGLVKNRNTSTKATDNLFTNIIKRYKEKLWKEDLPKDHLRRLQQVYEKAIKLIVPLFKKGKIHDNINTN